MSLKVQLTIDKTELLFQENTWIEVTITNQGTQPVEVLPPANTYKMPILKVTRVDSGAEQKFQRPPDMFVQEMPVTLAPGKSLSGRFTLLEIVKFDKAGQHDIACEWEWDNGAGRATSEPVRVTINPVQPRALSIVSAIGGPGVSYIGVWVNMAATPPTLCLTYFDLGRKPRVVLTRTVRPIPPSAQPGVSVHPNGRMANSLWIAWFDGDRLEIARTSENDARSPSMTYLGLPPLPKFLVAPLNLIEGPAGVEGKFFIWQGNKEGTVSRFQTVHLDSRGKAEAGANAMLTGSRPVWAEAAFLADMSSRTYALTQGEDEVTLQGVAWSASNQPATAKVLATWPGEFLAAGSMLAHDDAIYGAVLLLEPGPENSRRLILRSWSEDAKGKFEAGPELDLKRAPAERVGKALAAAGITGEPVALITFANNDMWESFREKTGRKPALHSGAVGDSPINVIFPNSTDPLILHCDQAGRGFLFAKFDGTPAQPPPSG